MTHLSDFSYLDREVTDILIFIWGISVVWSRTRFALLHPSRIKALHLKSMVTLLLLISLTLMIIYDAMAVYVKYMEGFYDDPDRGIINKPKEHYSKSNHDLIFWIDLTANMAYAVKTSAMFLLMAFWRSVTANLGLVTVKFKNSVEFRFYVVYSCVSICAYPTLQFIFKDDNTLSTIIPQFLYNAEVIVLASLSNMCNARFNKVIGKLGPQSTVRAKLLYYVRLNHLMTAACLLDCVSLFAINIEVVAITNVSDRRIYVSKFWSDLLTKTFTFGYTLSYLLVFLMIFPPPEIEKFNEKGSSSMHVPRGGGGATGNSINNSGDGVQLVTSDALSEHHLPPPQEEMLEGHNPVRV